MADDRGSGLGDDISEGEGRDRGVKGRNMVSGEGRCVGWGVRRSGGGLIMWSEVLTQAGH